MQLEKEAPPEVEVCKTRSLLKETATSGKILLDPWLVISSLRLPSLEYDIATILKQRSILCNDQVCSMNHNIDV